MDGIKYHPDSFLRDLQWLHIYHHNTTAAGNSGRGVRLSQSAKQEHERTLQAAAAAGTPISSAKERSATSESKHQTLKALSNKVRNLAMQTYVMHWCFCGV